MGDIYYKNDKEEEISEILPSSQLTNVVTGVPVILDFIDDVPENVFLRYCGGIVSDVLGRGFP